MGLTLWVSEFSGMGVVCGRRRYAGRTTEDREWKGSETHSKRLEQGHGEKRRGDGFLKSVSELQLCCM